MQNLINNIKNILIKFILYLNLEKDFKEEIIEKGFGIPIKLVNKDEEKYCMAIDGMPSDYYWKENLVCKKVFLTDKDILVEIEEIYEGLHFEAPCDKYSYKITKIEK